MSTTTQQNLSIHIGQLEQRLANFNYFLDPQQADMIRLVLENPVFGAQKIPRVRAIRLTGPAGSGKTFLAETISKVLTEATNTEHAHVYFQATRNMAEDEMFFGIMPGENPGDGFSRYDGTLLEAVKTSVKQPVVLTLDEWDKARPQADAMLLDFLQSGRISHPAVKLAGAAENLIVFVCTNDERELSEPLQRRCASITLAHPPVEIMARILTKECPDSGFVPHALKVYAQTLEAGLNKPATAQELVQMISALDHSEHVTAVQFVNVLNTFVLKTQVDRDRFTTWCSTNAEKSLKDLAKSAEMVAPAGTALSGKYVPFNPEKEHYNPLQFEVSADTSQIITPMRIWKTGYPDAATSKNGYAMFTGPTIQRAAAHIPSVTSRPDMWGVRSDFAISFDPLHDEKGYTKLAHLRIQKNVEATVVLRIHNPLVKLNRGFSVKVIARKSEENHRWDEACFIGTTGLADSQSRVWFFAHRDWIEVIITTRERAVPINHALTLLLGDGYMRWWTGQQDYSPGNKIFTTRRLNAAVPAPHGLFEAEVDHIDNDTLAELVKLSNERKARFTR